MDTRGVVAITGAGLGLGRSLLDEFAARGFRVLATVPEQAMVERLRDELAGTAAAGAVAVEVLDVTAPGEFSFPPNLQVLVNNAGVRRAYLPVEETPLDDWRDIFEVNFFGAVEVTRRAIPVLRSAGGGAICNINSRSILHPIPFLGPYRAAKKAMAALSETLRTELAPFGIRVVEILPGPMATGINTDSVMNRVADAVAFEPYAPMALAQREVNVGLPGAVPVAIAARAIADAVLDDDGPMRYGVCADSQASLDRWRSNTDEYVMRAWIEPLLVDHVGRSDSETTPDQLT